MGSGSVFLVNKSTSIKLRRTNGKNRKIDDQSSDSIDDITLPAMAKTTKIHRKGSRHKVVAALSVSV
jgi:hypothetical protein